MSKELGKWHYEFIAGREQGHQWRVGDQDDDVVTDFATEKAASDFVNEHNRMVDAANTLEP